MIASITPKHRQRPTDFLSTAPLRSKVATAASASDVIAGSIGIGIDTIATKSSSCARLVAGSTGIGVHTVARKTSAAAAESAAEPAGTARRWKRESQRKGSDEECERELHDDDFDDWFG